MNRPDGSTRCFAVLGSPVSHSLSPQMQNAALQAMGMNAVYLPFEVTPDRLSCVLDGMRFMGFAGANLTIPLKEKAFSILPPERLDGEARRFRAVNTVVFQPDGLHGHNTDGIGFLRDLRESLGVTPAGREVMIVGCGGAGRAVAIACAADGAARLLLANRTVERARKVAQDVLRVAPGIEITVLEENDWTRAARGADIIAQCSSLGMRPRDHSPLPASAFRPGQAAYDLVYVVPRTPFMGNAESAGAACANGLGMLLHQGAASLSLWMGREPDVEIMRRTLAGILYGKDQMR